MNTQYHAAPRGYCPVVGESHYQDSLRGLLATAPSSRIVTVGVEREPDNPFDPKAIRVFDPATGKTLGHLPRGTTGFARLLKDHGISCHAELTGGTPDKPSIGVVLHLQGEQEEPAARTGDGSHGTPGAAWVHTSMEVNMVLDDETGQVSYRDMQGNWLPESVERAARKQGKDIVRHLLEKKANEINAKLAELDRVYLSTPDPRRRPEFKAAPFIVPKPDVPVAEPIGLAGKLLPVVRRRREARNAERQAVYEAQLADREERLRQHESAELVRRQRFDAQIDGNPEAMQMALADRLAALEWPHKTRVNFQLQGADTLVLDVDLPEIEDLPSREASVGARGDKLNVKVISENRKRALYLKHVHAIGFRLLGECFTLLPTLNRMVLSAHSQRIDHSTGHKKDDYLYSTEVRRSDIEALNFHDLSAIDVVAAFEHFQLRREITNTGLIKKVEPFAVAPSTLAT